jgi:hypothetical protein
MKHLACREPADRYGLFGWPFAGSAATLETGEPQES